MKIAVIGTGNGGQGVAGFLAREGHEVALYGRNTETIDELKEVGGIHLRGRLKGFGKLSCITANLEEAIKGAELIMVVTTANAHKPLAKQLATIVEENQIIILNPGRTCGAMEFNQALLDNGCNKRLYIAEAQTLVYACRIIKNGKVNVIGVKDEVFLSALPSSDTSYVIEKTNEIYPCFKPAKNVLQTSLENIGAIFHPCVLLFNAATIERKHDFYFYRDMTPKIAEFIEEFDKERVSVGKAYGIDLLCASEWVTFAYQGTSGDTLCEKMKNNPAYYDIKSPSSIYTRQLMEDIPTGVLPIMELGKVAGLEMKLFESMILICEALLGVDFRKDGRTLESLGLAGLTKEEILNHIH